MKLLIVGLGGAIGAIFRYIISLIPIKTEFPFLTFITNFLGALLIGVVLGLAEQKNLSQNLILFIKVGICGGFTTFSTFAAESLGLINKENYFIGAIYICLSICVCIFSVYLGKQITLHI